MPLNLLELFRLPSILFKNNVYVFSAVTGLTYTTHDLAVFYLIKNSKFGIHFPMAWVWLCYDWWVIIPRATTRKVTRLALHWYPLKDRGTRLITWPVRLLAIGQGSFKLNIAANAKNFISKSKSKNNITQQTSLNQVIQQQIVNLRITRWAQK